MHKEYLVPVYLPIALIILTIIILLVDKKLSYKPLYIVNGIFLTIEVTIYIIVMFLLPVGYGQQYPYLDFLPLVWLVSLFAGVCTTIASYFIYFITKAEAHLWARAVLFITYSALFLLLLYGLYIFILGILSLKSG